MSEDAPRHVGLVTGLNVISVFCSDLERAKAFYVGTLGFKQTGEMPPGITLGSGDVAIYLEGGRTPRSGPRLAGSEVSPAFATQSVRATFEKLKQAGVTIVGEYQQFGDQFAFFKCADPDGNVLEFAGTP